uniref:Tetrahydrofolate dehydrogenase/cyclohydrolase NAD(P)-binding domain-containing protein n=1 Tax=Nomascus leucogenys TaxID=61853 RepID=A0A2I3GCC4_NOMLE
VPVTARAMAAASSCQCCSLRPHPFHLRAVRNEAVVISGRKLAQQIKQEVWQEVEEWVASGNKWPHLSMILVSENPASNSYAYETSFNFRGKIDVDDFHVINVGRMCLNQYSTLPATPWGVWKIIKQTGIPTLGKNVVVAGRSKNVEMPIAMLLHTDGAHEGPRGDATVTISHGYTPKEQLKKHTILADIVISAAGIPNLITADMIKEGAAIVNVGINRVQDPVTLVGDVDFEGVRQKAGYITPVPGGVGPITAVMLMKNTIITAKKVLRHEEREVLKSKELGVATN